MKSLHVLDVFSGIGGFSLGLENAEMQTVAFCEADAFCRDTLKEHWPNTHIFSDIRTLTSTCFKHTGLPMPDVIAGGFPCQDISVAGKRAGITGNRSSLWKEFKRIIDEFEPHYAIIENVAHLRNCGLSTVLYDLWQIGYDAEWHCITASAVGAPHRRDRIWIIAYPNEERCRRRGNYGQRNTVQSDQEWQDRTTHEEWQSQRVGASTSCKILADSLSKGLQRYWDTGSASQICTQESISLFRCTRGIAQWGNEPEDIPRTKDGQLNPDWVEWLMGFPVGWTALGSRKQRLMGLGNAIVPQIAEIIGKQINTTSHGTLNQNQSNTVL